MELTTRRIRGEHLSRKGGSEADPEGHAGSIQPLKTAATLASNRRAVCVAALRYSSRGWLAGWLAEFLVDSRFRRRRLKRRRKRIDELAVPRGTNAAIVSDGAEMEGTSVI